MSEATIPIQAAAPPRLSEDLVAVGLGLGVFVLALLLLLGADALGWLVTTSVWTHPSTALAPATKAYASLGGLGSLLVSYVVLTAVLSASCSAPTSSDSRPPSRRSLRSPMRAGSSAALRNRGNCRCPNPIRAMRQAFLNRCCRSRRN